MWRVQQLEVRMLPVICNCGRLQVAQLINRYLGDRVLMMALSSNHKLMIWIVDMIGFTHELPIFYESL